MELRVDFVLLGDPLDPAQLTARLGRQPSQTWRKGESIQGTLLRRERSGWSLSTGYRQELDLSKMIREIVGEVQTFKPQVLAAIEELRLEARLECVVSAFEKKDEESWPIITLEPTDLLAIAELKATIDFDII